MNMKSSKVPYVIAGSAIGGAAAFLLLTDSGRRVRSSIRTMDANTIPNKLEQFRGAVDRRAQDVTRKVDSFREKITGSIDAGKRAYGETGEGFRTRMRRMEETDGHVADGVVKSSDVLKW